MTGAALPANLGLRNFTLVWRGLKRGMLILAMLVAGGALSLQLSGLDPRAPVGADSASLRSQIAIGLAFATILVFGSEAGRRWPALLRANLLLLALPGLALLSTLWAPEPAVALRRAGAFAATILCGVSIVAGAGPRGALRIVAQTAAAGLVLSVIYLAGFPAFGVHQVSDGVQNTHAGDWRGLFVHRTALGQLAALSLALAVHGGVLAFRRMATRIGVIVVAGLCLIEAHSGGALISAAILLAAPPIVRAGRRIFVRSSLVGAGLIVGGAILTVLLAPLLTPLILQALGKDATLTGRTELWRLMMQIAAQRPWLGYGYSTGFRDTVAALVANLSAFGYVPNAQDGYLDTLLNLGLVGLALATAMLLSASWRAVRWAGDEADGAMVPLLILIFMVEMNIGEAALISANDLFVLIFAVAVAASGEGLMPSRRSDPPPPGAGRSRPPAGTSR